MGCAGGNHISEKEYQKMVEEIKTFQSETIVKHNYLEKEFKSSKYFERMSSKRPTFKNI